MKQNWITRRRLVGLVIILIPSVALLTICGCALVGVFAGKLVPPPTVPAKYAGLKGQTVAVMVWAADGALIDFPNIRLDIAGSLENKLLQAQQVKTKELEGATFPVAPASIIKLQENHPEFETQPLTDVAPKFGAGRVIYIELEDIQTRSNASVELFRGSGSATLKIVEIADGKAKIAYEESNIVAVFPPKAREEGTPNGNDFAIYRGTVDQLTTEIAKRFVPYQEDQ